MVSTLKSLEDGGKWEAPEPISIRRVTDLTSTMGSSTIMTSASKDRAISLFNALKWPLIAYGVVFAYYTAMIPGKIIWFSYHPPAMIISFVALAGNAALIKKVGGYENTKIHVRLAECVINFLK